MSATSSGGSDVGEQVTRLADVAEQVGAGRKGVGEFLDQRLELRGRDRAEACGGARHFAQLLRFEMLEQAVRGRLAHRQ